MKRSNSHYVYGSKIYFPSSQQVTDSVASKLNLTDQNQADTFKPSSYQNFGTDLTNTYIKYYHYEYLNFYYPKSNTK